jgi:hypothetical protein
MMMVFKMPMSIVLNKLSRIGMTMFRSHVHFVVEVFQLMVSAMNPLYL